MAYGAASGPSPAELPIGRSALSPIGRSALSPPSVLLPPNVERTTELEVGVDATVGQRVSVEVTGFRSRSTHLFTNYPSPPTSGVPGPGSDLAPGGEMRNDGVEGFVTARVVDRSRLRWDVSVDVATLRNRVVTYGVDVNGRPIPGPTPAGYPRGGYWDIPYTYSDANGDHLIEQNEVHLGQRRYLGPALPTVESALGSRLMLPGGIDLFVLFDYRGGQKQFNLTESLRCGGFAYVCRGVQDPAAPLAEQAAAMALRLGSGAGYIQDGSFVKLREASIRWRVPRRWTRGVGGVAVALAGRNLATWTRYTGLDPEVSSLVTSSPSPVEFLKSPVPREVLLRIDVGQSP